MNYIIKTALAQFEKFKNSVKNHKHMVYVDFSKSSHLKRLYVIDIDKQKVIRSHHVAHGSGSNCANKKYACNFSNKFGSRKSSLGAMKTGEVYTWGKRFPTKRKLKLHSLESKNSNVFGRGIIIHSANYVTDSFIARNGRCGNTWGCFAVDPSVCDSLIDLVKEGCLLYANY